MDKLLSMKKTSKALTKSENKTFHTHVMKYTILYKNRRPDVSTGVTYLSTRIKETTEDDWKIF